MLKIPNSLQRKQSVGPVSRFQRDSHDHTALLCWRPGVGSASGPRLIPVVSPVSQTDHPFVIFISSFVFRVLSIHTQRHTFDHTYINT